MNQFKFNYKYTWSVETFLFAFLWKIDNNKQACLLMITCTSETKKHVPVFSTFVHWGT